MSVPKDESVSDDLFSYVLSDDKSKLKLVLREATVELSADKVVRLALFFANLRAEMSPPVPEHIPHDQAVAEADRYEVFQKPEDGTAQVYLRIPGLCWSFTQFSKDQCVRLSEVLHPQPSGLDKSQLN